MGEQTTEEVAAELRRATSSEILTRVGSAVDGNLEALTGGVHRQSSSLGFTNDENLIDIARDLRFKLADHGLEPEDLRYSGHGYANLLFMATIAIELERSHDVDLTLFLVEEPEAHLHPQLQAAVLGFLEDQAEKSKSRKVPLDAPAGRVQVVVATHSPNLTAWVQNQKIVVFRTAPVLEVADAPTTILNATGELPRPIDSSTAASRPPETGVTQIFWDRLEAWRFSSLVAALGDVKVIAKTVLGYCDGCQMHLFEGAIEGTVPPAPAGPEDFQWDCVFIPDGYTKTFAEMGAEKDDVSMRRLALDRFAAHLKTSKVTT